MFNNIEHGGISLFERYGILGLGRGRVVRIDHGGLGSFGKLAHQTIMRILVPQDPAAAVEVKNDRQLSASPFGPDEPGWDLTRGPYGQIFVMHVHREFLDRFGLRVRQNPSGGLGRKGIQRRIVFSGDGVDKRFRRLRQMRRTGRCCGHKGLLAGNDKKGVVQPLLVEINDMPFGGLHAE